MNRHRRHQDQRLALSAQPNRKRDASHLGLRRPGNDARHTSILPHRPHALPTGARTPARRIRRRGRLLVPPHPHLRRSWMPQWSSFSTNRESPSFDVNRGAWLEKYAGNIKAFVETDCTDPKSISRLKEQIQEQLNGLESLKARFPTRWFAIKEKLARMSDDFVSFADYRHSVPRPTAKKIRKNRTRSPASSTISASRSTTRTTRASALPMS